MLDAGLPEEFEVTLADITGSESTLLPRQNATAYFASSNTSAPGVVGWDYFKGRVLSVSTLLTQVELKSDPYRRLFTNAVRWVTNRSAPRRPTTSAPIPAVPATTSGPPITLAGRTATGVWNLRGRSIPFTYEFRAGGIVHYRSPTESSFGRYTQSGSIVTVRVGASSESGKLQGNQLTLDTVTKGVAGQAILTVK